MTTSVAYCVFVCVSVCTWFITEHQGLRAFEKAKIGQKSFKLDIIEARASYYDATSEMFFEI